MRTCVAYELPCQIGFPCLFAVLVLSSHGEKNQENSLGPGYLRVDFLNIIGILKIFLYVDSVTKKMIHVHD